MKFCFFGDISNSLRGKTKGGGELQVALLAKALALKGQEVIIIDPYSEESFITDEGIKVINVPDWNKGMRGLRLLQYRIPALYKLFKQQKADYYYGRMRTYFHIITYWAAKKLKKKYILAVASDVDILNFQQIYKYEYKPNFGLFRYLTLLLPGDIVFRYLMKKADYVFLQHAGQDINWGLMKGKKVIFPNIIDQQYPAVIKNTSNDYFLYLGSLSILKGSDKLYQLASMIDGNVKLIIVGQPNDEKSTEIFEGLKKIPNVDVKGRLNHRDSLQLVANAKALINTSNYEGFPNVFLEAWSLKIPVLSLKVNPGNIFDNYDLGVCFKGDLMKMKEHINRNEMVAGNNGEMLAYIAKFHDFNTAGERFLNTLNNRG
jgi:hypothetical protein